MDNITKIFNDLSGIIESPDSFAKEIANMNLMWGEWLGSKGSESYYWYKSNEDKVRIFEKWAGSYIKKRLKSKEKSKKQLS